MNIQDILTQAAGSFIKGAGSSGGGLNVNMVVSALASLLGGGDGKLDLAGLVSGMKGAGLASMAASWLGDGGNDAISAESIMNLFGDSKLSSFADMLGMPKPDAVSGLQAAIPEIVDKASSGGDLVQGLAGGDLGGMVKGLFG